MEHKILIAISFAVLAALLLAGCGSPTPVVKKVDHVVVTTGDPKQLFDLFTGTLGLPTAWPLADYPEFSTGGVQAGNVNIETLRLGPAVPQGSKTSVATMKTAIYGIVFEPYPLAAATKELQARGAKPGKPSVQTAPFNGKNVPVWTNVTLNALSRPFYTVYLCQYSPSYAAVLSSHKASGTLGAIGLTSVRQVVIASKDPDAVKKQWQKALAPAPMSSDGVMTVGTGPQIRFIKGSEDTIVSMLWEVASLSKAKALLEQNKLLGPSSASELSIAPEAVQGLDIRMVEAAK